VIEQRMGKESAGGFRFFEVNKKLTSDDSLMYKCFKDTAIKNAESICSYASLSSNVFSPKNRQISSSTFSYIAIN